MNMQQTVVSPIVVPEFGPQATNPGNRAIDVLSEVHAVVTVVAGRTGMTLQALHDLRAGDIIMLDRTPESTVDIYVNGTHVARGDVMVLDDSIATRVAEIDRIPDDH